MSSRKTAGEALRDERVESARSHGANRALVIIATLFVALAISAPHAARALDLKGVELGQSVPIEQLRAQLGVDKYTCEIGKSYCMGFSVVEGVGVETGVSFAHKDGVVTEISAKFNPLHFDELLAAATRKWGKPTSALMNIPESNAFGATRRNAIIQWEQPDGHEVTLVKYIDLESSSLTLGTPAPKKNPADSRM